ncbi:MAG TPA: hypothetical protein VM553_09325, partial [Dongiaceae bacterium]|nr:hypothetical protein [Dongiaceae bacterium]
SKNRTLSIPFEFMVISAALILACLFLTALQLKKNGGKVSIDVIWFLVAMIIWSAFSFGQALTTGKDYYHYFVPCYIPLSFLIARAVHISSIKFVTPFYLLGCVGACLITLHSSADYVYEIAKSKNRFNEICKLGDFHYDGDLLSIYRICNVTTMKYMFPPFYQDKHFAELSNSGGMEWLKQIDKKIVVDRNEELIIYSSGREYYDKRFGNAP